MVPEEDREACQEEAAGDIHPQERAVPWNIPVAVVADSPLEGEAAPLAASFGRQGSDFPLRTCTADMRHCIAAAPLPPNTGRHWRRWPFRQWRRPPHQWPPLPRHSRPPPRCPPPEQHQWPSPRPHRRQCFDWRAHRAGLLAGLPTDGTSHPRLETAQMACQGRAAPSRSVRSAASHSRRPRPPRPRKVSAIVLACPVSFTEAAWRVVRPASSHSGILLHRDSSPGDSGSNTSTPAAEGQEEPVRIRPAAIVGQLRAEKHSKDNREAPTTQVQWES